MQVHYGFDNLEEIKNPVVTTGTFDGVHLGHKVILNRINKLAQNINGESVLITFHPHPRKVLYPDTVGKSLRLIATQDEKIDLLKESEIDHVIIVKFTIDFSKITSHEFIMDYLIGKLKAKTIVVGFNHHFGHNREGDYDYLYQLANKHNFNVEEIPMQEVQNETVSSTKIREAVTVGYIQKVNAYLDSIYFIKGFPQLSDSVFSGLGFPTIKVPVEEKNKLIPPKGIYACRLKSNKLDMKCVGIISNSTAESNININDLFIDVHLLEETLIDDKEKVNIRFHKKINDLPNFSNHIELKKVLQKSKNEIEELIY